MSEGGRDGQDNRGEWLDNDSPMPILVKVGGLIKTVIGYFRPNQTSVQNLEDLKSHGADINIIQDKDGKDVVEVSVTTGIIPRKGKSQTNQ